MIAISDQKAYKGADLIEAVPIVIEEGDTAKYPNKIKEDIPAYFPGEDLVKVVEYARILNRPLLIRGEPGCGKTRLAQAVAYELYGQNYREKYFEWHIKSTTKVNEGLYHFDHLARLRDVQLNQGSNVKEQDLKIYRSFGPVGNAFLKSEENKPTILLIDEIDKADIDFPNDLLLELDQKKFFISETNETITAKEPPIIFITSNDEKELPNAFLRRCVFYYIDFPGDEQLLKIIKAQVKSQESQYNKALPDELLSSIIKRFRALYDKMDKNPNTAKKVSTSELLDWVKVIHYYYFTGKLLPDIKELPEDLLYPEILLKTLDDQKNEKAR